MTKRLLFTAACLAFAATSMAAELGRVYVSASGRDTDTCGSISKPCQTLRASVTRVSPGGEIVFADPGTYEGASLTKPLTISALPTVGTIQLAALGLSVDIGTLKEDVVTLRGLHLAGATVGITGVQLYRGRSLQIEGGSIANMGNGVYASTGQVVITGTTFRNNGAALTAQASAAKVGVTAVGATFESNWDAIIANGNSTITLRSCTFADNVDGVMTFPSADQTAAVYVFDSTFAGNNTGIFANAGGGTASVRLSNVTITGNQNGVQISSDATVFSTGNNVIEGNGSDVDGVLTPAAVR